MDHFDIVDDYAASAASTKKRCLGPMVDLETRTFSDCVVYTDESQYAAGTAEPTGDGVVSSKRSDANDKDADSSGTDSEDDAPKSPKEEPPILTSTEFYDAFVKRTEQECAIEASAPQRSEAWIRARKFVVTASIFGAALGHNSYESPEKCAITKVWNTFQGNSFTAYGTFHETDARDTFLKLLEGPLRKTMESFASGDLESYELYETGLLKHHDMPWVAVSPDGILCLKGSKGLSYVLVEYKCPARLRDSYEHPYKKYPGCIPPYYMDQMQGIMGYLNDHPSLLDKGPGHFSGAFFVVWQPHQIHVTLAAYKMDYYKTQMVPGLEDWYFKKYLPLEVLAYNKELVPNSNQAGSVIVVDS